MSLFSPDFLQVYFEDLLDRAKEKEEKEAKRKRKEKEEKEEEKPSKVPKLCLRDKTQLVLSCF